MDDAIITLVREHAQFKVALEKLKREVQQKQSTEGYVLFDEKELNEIFAIAGIGNVIYFDNCKEVAMKVVDV